MKRTILFTLALLALGASLAVAQTTPPAGPPSGQRVGPNFVDANGDGICDLYQTRQATGQKAGKGYGPGNGTGNRGAGPRDGTGYGAGRGTCNGTGTGTPQGRAYRGGRGGGR
jgi:hypothetical protein